MDMRNMVPPLSIAYKAGLSDAQQGLRKDKSYVAHQSGMADLVPADGEKFKWVDDHSRAWDVPQAKQDDCIHNYLTIPCWARVQRGGRAKGKQLTT